MRRIPVFIMALLTILQYPDPRLHKVAKPVAEVDDRIRQLVKDMAETMYDAPGIGLAATQIDVHEQVIVMDLSETRDELRVFINPEIVWRSDEQKVYEEGCLSVPGIYDEVERPDHVRVRALNERGETFELDCEACWPCACSMKWIICWARSSSNISPRSSATASAPRC